MPSVVNDMKKQDTDMLTPSLYPSEWDSWIWESGGFSASASEAVQVKTSAGEVLVRQSHLHPHIPWELGLLHTSSTPDPRRECQLGAGVCSVYSCSIYAQFDFIHNSPCSKSALNKNKALINGDCQMIVSKVHSCSDLKHQGNQQDLHCTTTINF